MGPWSPDTWVAGISGAAEQAVEREVSRGRRLVCHRWPDMTVSTVTTPPVEAILAEARRRRAGVIVVGSRGLGFAGRLMLGRVSRVDGRAARSSWSRADAVGSSGRSSRPTVPPTRAGRWASCSPASSHRPARVTVARVLEPMLPHTRSLLPAGIRRAVLASAASLNANRTKQARREARAASRDSCWGASPKGRSTVHRCRCSS